MRISIKGYSQIFHTYLLDCDGGEIADVQREQTVAVNPGIATISPKRSLPTSVQFRHFPLPKNRKSFDGQDQFLPCNCAQLGFVNVDHYP
nr:hypothetical protein [uncultured Rhodoferax sp.]